MDGLHKRREVWYYSLNVNGKRQFFSTKTKNYHEARAIFAKAREDQAAGRLPNDLSRWPFEDLLAHVREQRKLHLSAGTIRLEKERSVQLLKIFKGVRVSNINATAIRKYQQTRAKVVSGRTINLEIKVLRTILQPAKTWTAITADYKPLPEDRRGPGRAITEAEERLLLNVAQSRPGWDAAFLAALAAANTTCRGVELKNLRLSDVDLMNREVSINRTKGNTGGVRKIPLNADAMWAFTRLLERARALGANAPGHFLFPAFEYRSKTPGHGAGFDPTRHQKSWRTAWRRLIQETARRAAEGITTETEQNAAKAPFIGLRFHDLRHLAITKLAESDASDATIMSISGHLSREMMEHYSHVRADKKRAAVDAMPSYITPKEETPASSAEPKPTLQ
jgi:integrase